MARRVVLPLCGSVVLPRGADVRHLRADICVSCSLTSGCNRNRPPEGGGGRTWPGEGRLFRANLWRASPWHTSTELEFRATNPIISASPRHRGESSQSFTGSAGGGTV